MNGATDIISEIKTYLMANKCPTTSDAAVTSLCDDVRLALQLWNKAFLMTNKKDPDNQHCNMTQFQIDLAVDQVIRLKLPITPKMPWTYCACCSSNESVSWLLDDA